MANLPLRQMVLYKHGVGFFQREGDVTEEEITLSFRHDEINDVLKSLAAFDREGGQILGIHYQTPMDKQARLDDSSIRLSGSESLRDLLRDLRGRRVELTLTDRVVAGRMVGIDLPGDEPIGETLISIIREGSDAVLVLALKDLRGMRILDDRAHHDLHYFLDTSMSEELRRQMTIRLSAGHHRLVVYYVAPSPTWRVSYRLILEAAENDEGGQALLQGWGLFDNRLDEDLKEVMVTLVAGQPISFIYDLYASRIPERPSVVDEARIVPGPVEFEGRRPAAPAAGAPPQARMMADREMATFLSSAALDLATDESSFQAADLADSLAISARAGDAGEFFQYVVTAPVSVKRGDSAMVPIIGASFDYGKEILYNGQKLMKNPVLAVRFTNLTGLTLERGPVTLVENGSYVGEAVVPFTQDGREVYLAYAVELGITVTETVRHTVKMAGLSIKDRYLINDIYEVDQTTYQIENTTGDERIVTIEKLVRSPYELFDTDDPDVVTPGEYRWQIAAAAGITTEFVVQERYRTSRREEIRQLSYQRLQRYLADRWIDQSTYSQLAALLEDLALIEQLSSEQANLYSERDAVYIRQGQLRENLNALQRGGDEDEVRLRQRMLSQLEASEDRLAEIETTLQKLSHGMEAAQTRIDQTLDSLGGASARAGSGV